MKTSVKILLVLFLVAVVLNVAAQEGVDRTYDVVITDAATGYLAGCTEVRIYSVDPIESVRLAKEPVAKLSYPENKSPIQLQLAPGRYELDIWMSYLPDEVLYTYFDVVPVVEAVDGQDNEVNVVDVTSVEIPAELITY